MRWLWANPSSYASLAGWDGKAAAYALYFFTDSMWDMPPQPFRSRPICAIRFRSMGIGKALLQHMAVIARAQLHRYALEVLDWNATAIDFCRSVAARLRNRWLPMQLRGRAFEESLRMKKCHKLLALAGFQPNWGTK